MRTLRLSGLVVITLFVAAPASAQSVDQPPEQRRQVAPLIRALTNCVAKQTLQEDAGAVAYRDGTFNAYVVRMIGRCQNVVSDLVGVYDRVSGEGAGIAFLNGPYSNDLPRAVLRRIRSDLDSRVAVFNRVAAEQASREAQQQADAANQRRAADQALADEAKAAEAERQARTELAKQQAAQAVAATTQAQAVAQVATAKVESERQLRLAEAKKSEYLIVEKAADCAHRQLTSLVKSGESAEVLATAVMTLCSTEVHAAVDSSYQRFQLETQAGGNFGEASIREKVRADMRDEVIALAVQAKAGAGAFAPASN